jgi:hypothetical protein
MVAEREALFPAEAAAAQHNSVCRCSDMAWRNSAKSRPFPTQMNNDSVQPYMRRKQCMHVTHRHMSDAQFWFIYFKLVNELLPPLSARVAPSPSPATTPRGTGE